MRSKFPLPVLEIKQGVTRGKLYVPMGGFFLWGRTMASAA